MTSKGFTVVVASAALAAAATNLFPVLNFATAGASTGGAVVSDAMLCFKPTADKVSLATIGLLSASLR